MTEMLKVYTEDFTVVEIMPRSEIHDRGLLHQVVHCWIYETKDNQKWIYLQQRSFDKAIFPGCYDIAAAGHIDADEDPVAAVKREAKEELGIVLEDKDLTYFGCVRERFKIGKFDDNEFCQAYLYSINNVEFHPGEEVERMVKVSIEEFKKWYDESAEKLTAYSLDGIQGIDIDKSKVVLHDKKYISSVVEFLLNI